MKSQGSLVPVGLIALALGGGVGCKKDEPPKPDPAVTAASAAASAHLANRRGPRVPPFNPQEMKDYRVDVCYYGTFSLRQARDAYLASLGKDEPSAKKIPSFGTPPPPPATGPLAKASSAPAPKAAPGSSAVQPVAAGSAGHAPSALPPGAMDHRFDFMMRVPHERNARACSAVVQLKDPPMGEVDTQAAIYAPFVVEIAKDITTAHEYYAHEEYTKDGFAKGKELDKKLREEFAKLDEMSDKFGAALVAWRQEHPLDAAKMDEGEKVSRGVIDDARDVFMMVVTKKADGEAWKAAVDKLDKSAGALKAFADGHATDNWSKIMSKPVEEIVKVVKGAKITPDKTFDSDTLLTLNTSFTALFDARQRSLNRMANARPQMQPQAVPGAPQMAPTAPGKGW